MRHTVTVKELTDWIKTEAWHNAASSHGNGSHKIISMSNSGEFRVTDHDNITYSGTDMSAAVDAYNAAR